MLCLKVHPLYKVLQSMLEFIKKASTTGGKQLLVAHNGIRFDFNILDRELSFNHLSRGSLTYVDSMKLFALQNNKLPTLPSGMKGKKQGHVYSHLFNENLPHAHTALFDTCSLARILVKLLTTTFTH